MSEQKPPLLLSNYFVEKLDYEALPGFNPAEPGAEVMAVDPDVYPVPDKADMYMVRLRVALAGPPKSNSRCRLSLSLVGFFQVDTKAPEKLRSDMVFGNAPLILFGIARQITAETTANGPYGKIILGTVNFVEILKRKAAGRPEPTAVEFSVSEKPAARPPRRLNRV